jgi:hypothetical protein
MCGLFPLDFGSDYSYKFPLCPLCKGEALELFSIEIQLISSQNGTTTHIAFYDEYLMTMKIFVIDYFVL